MILPLGADRTLTIFEWFFAEPGSGAGWESMQQTIAFSDEIQQEDIAICEQVQRGLRSRSYDRGRFSAKRENGVYHFQQLVARLSQATTGILREPEAPSLCAPHGRSAVCGGQGLMSRTTLTVALFPRSSGSLTARPA